MAQPDKAQRARDGDCMKRVDYSGRRYGRLLVAAMVYEPGKDAKAKCLCDCGKERLVTAYNLKSGNTTSCGCLASEKTAARSRGFGERSVAINRKHGYSKTPTYASWSDAKKRCYSPQNKRYPEYGGRGIGMCDAWRNSFEEFLHDMGDRPPRMTLERLDVNKWYEPGNCIWATRTQQARNTRANVATMEMAREIRQLRASGQSLEALATRFSMSYGNVCMICRGVTWKEEADAH